ncbi:MAG: tRNA lysidine(34) synthetase TilS [Elusimicrobia bacterium]|nr:tRNA lysidine(34) synthetase TilS [Elusimicrobiota bacterium]
MIKAAPSRSIAPSLHRSIANSFWGTTWKKFKSQAGRLIRPGDRILVLVSGGPDSTALAYWMHLLSKNIRFFWAIAHFDHRLRKESANEAAAVGRLAESLGVPFYLKRFDAGGFAGKRRLSLEDADRKLRYQAALFLAGTRRFNKVAAAHTLDEQAESVLLNIIRGGSLSGLLGARRVRPIIKGSKILLIRPMIRIPKSEVLNFLRQAGIAYFDDPMNHDPRFL